MNLIRRILCPLDVDSPAGSALQYSFALADRFHASIDVVHACSPRYPRPFESLADRLAGLMSDQRLRERLEKALNTVPTAMPGRATAHIIDGQPAASLLTHSRRNKFDLVVLSSRRSREYELAFPPGIGETVAHHAHCAVLSLCESKAVVSPVSIARILLAVDFSEATDISVDWTAAFARIFGARVRLIHVQNAPESRRSFRGFSNRELNPGSVADRLDLIAQRIMQRGVQVEFSALSEGCVADRVVDHATSTSSELIVLGVHECRGVHDRAIEGVVADVRRRSRVPVLSVRKSRAESLFASPMVDELARPRSERTAQVAAQQAAGLAC